MMENNFITDEEIQKRILFEDNHLLIINKPPNVTTEGSFEDTLENLLAKFIAKRDQKPGKAFIKAVHRLDRPASGLTVFAKTSKALTRLQKQMRENFWQKKYLAKLERAPKEKKGELKHYLIKKDRKAHVTDKEHGKLSILSYEMIDETLCDITLITGRYHQIRAQFASIGSLIVGDTKYGAKPHKEGEISLIHYFLSLEHPITKEKLTYELEPSED